jgi:hypothetical protein
MSAPRPDPAIVAAIYDLDPNSLRWSMSAATALVPNPQDARRWDGKPASPEQIAAASSARYCDWQAAHEMHRHALEQSRYELDRKERIAALLHKYASGNPAELLGFIEPRMTAADRAEYRRLWDDLGNVMVMHGDNR